MAPSELSPRLLLAETLRIVLVFFLVLALANQQSYHHHAAGPAPGILCWLTLAFNALLVAAAALHPRLQRLAAALPFPVTVTVRGRTLLEYGNDGDDRDGGRGEGLVAPLPARVGCLLVDAALATLLLVFGVVLPPTTTTTTAAAAADDHDNKGARGTPWWIRNAWITVVVFEYVLAFVQACEVVGILIYRRHVRGRGRISLA